MNPDEAMQWVCVAGMALLMLITVVLGAAMAVRTIKGPTPAGRADPCQHHYSPCHQAAGGWLLLKCDHCGKVTM